MFINPPQKLIDQQIRPGVRYLLKGCNNKPIQIKVDQRVTCHFQFTDSNTNKLHPIYQITNSPKELHPGISNLDIHIKKIQKKDVKDDSGNRIQDSVYKAALKKVVLNIYCVIHGESVFRNILSNHIIEFVAKPTKKNSCMIKNKNLSLPIMSPIEFIGNESTTVIVILNEIQQNDGFCLKISGENIETKQIPIYFRENTTLIFPNINIPPKHENYMFKIELLGSDKSIIATFPDRKYISVTKEKMFEDVSVPLTNIPVTWIHSGEHLQSTIPQTLIPDEIMQDSYSIAETSILETMEQFYSKSNGDITESTTYLHVASSNIDVPNSVIDELIFEKYDTMARDEQGRTCFEVAIQNNNERVFQILMNHALKNTVDMNTHVIIQEIKRLIDENPVSEVTRVLFEQKLDSYTKDMNDIADKCLEKLPDMNDMYDPLLSAYTCLTK